VGEFVSDTSATLLESSVTAPKYQSVHDALVVMMETLAPGSAMPTERELCQTFSVSRATIRQALGQLEIEQRIYRRQGKGTFVAQPKIEQPLELMSHTEGMRARGIIPSSKLIDVRRVPAGIEVGARLGLSSKAEVLRIERLRLADGDPIAIEVVFLNADRFDGITAALSDSASLYQLLSSNYGVELASAEETIEAVIAEGREAGLLKCQPGMPLLMLSRRTLDTKGEPTEFVRSLYRGDRYRFQTGLRRPQANSAIVTTAQNTLSLRVARTPDDRAMAQTFIAAWDAAYRGIVEDAIIDGLDEDEITKWMNQLLEANTAQTIVAEMNGSVVGFARFGTDPDNPDNGHLHALYVRPDTSGKGIGRSLLERVLLTLDPLSTRTVTLWVFEANARAQRLYASLGFVPDGETRVEDEWRANEIHMRRFPSRRAMGAHSSDGEVPRHSTSHDTSTPS
jgi:GntR family transcriptional regulator